ncbi:hypothetical protein G7054_g4921 [Neopestalotiopsis clavispora]|nr:hypothetical protein G7054_g4921 [Neopestalotiopsis clavispora]
MFQAGYYQGTLNPESMHCPIFPSPLSPSGPLLLGISVVRLSAEAEGNVGTDTTPYVQAQIHVLPYLAAAAAAAASFVFGLMHYTR